MASEQSDTPTDSFKSADKFSLHVTAGNSYDPSTHDTVIVNGQEPYVIESDLATVYLWVRIKDYQGLPSHCPDTHPYFSDAKRDTDLYAISIALVPKKPIPGDELVFGNDFDRPIRDRMPPGAGYALKIVNWWIDPGLEGDMYADQPYLYGPALSSWNYLSICDKQESTTKDATSDIVVEEGGVSSGLEQRKSLGIPDDPAERKRFFLEKQNRANFQFEPGRLYRADFGNSYLGFGDCSLRLPGWSVVITDYVDEQIHELRYVLKNKATGDLLFATRLVLTPKNQSAEEKQTGTEDQTRQASKDDDKGTNASEEEAVD